MGILVECPNCRTRSGLSRKVCNCGHRIQKSESKNYWIEYYYKKKQLQYEGFPSEEFLN